MTIASPSTDLYTLGRGYAKMGVFTGTTPPTYPDDYVDLGNIKEFKLQCTQSLLDHYSMRSGLKSKDKTVVLEAGYNLSFIADEISLQNLLFFLRGTQSGNVIRANTALNLEFAMRFESTNPVGEKQRFKFHRFQLSAAGDWNLIADTWEELSFKGDGLLDLANNPDSPHFDCEIISTTTD